MDDGRYLTDYRNMTIVNELYKMENKIVKNHMHRSNLLNNAEKIRKENLDNEKCNQLSIHVYLIINLLESIHLHFLMN